MSLLMYRDGVLSADRRFQQTNNSPNDYDALEIQSKIYVCPKREVLMGSVGFINSPKILMQYSEVIREFRDKDPLNWHALLFEANETKQVFLNDTTMFLFFAGKFFIMKSRKEKVSIERACLNSPRLSGSGDAAGHVIVRSKRDFDLKTFYRIVSAACEGVSTNFDAIELKTIKGF